MSNKVALFLQYGLPRGPLLLGTTLSHYTFGPQRPSWPYKLSLVMAMVQSFAYSFHTDVPLKKAQALSRLNDKYAPVHPGALASETTIPNTFRDQAAVHVDALLNAQGVDAAKLGWDWKNDPRAEKPLRAEWTETREKDENFSEGRTVLYLHGGGYFLCSIKTHRWASWNMARLGGARVLSIDYRLAPDSPFPAALHDALAAYLYLINPPPDSGVRAVDPKNIVIMGDSAGGGLTFATMLAIRDSGLPMPAGIIGWSPWIDLLHSMPSSAAKFAATLAEDSDVHLHEEFPQIQYYTNNKMLDCKFVSPVLENNLDGACPIMIIAGDAEMLRDESVVFAKKHASGKSPVLLRLYDDMPHVFQVFGFLPSAKHSLRESGDFIRKVTLGGPGVGPDTKSYERISAKGERRPLEEEAASDWAERMGKLGGGSKYLAKL